MKTHFIEGPYKLDDYGDDSGNAIRGEIIAGGIRVADLLDREDTELEEAVWVGTAKVMTAGPELFAQLEDAADALDQVIAWMNDVALPQLGDDCDGGNSLSAGLEHTVEAIRDKLKEVASVTKGKPVAG